MVPAAKRKSWRKTWTRDDLAITSKGAIYFTDSAHKTVGYVDAKGQARIVYNGGEIALPSGVALSPDQAMLIVTDAQSRFSWSFQIAPDGSLINGEPFYRLEMPESGWMSGVTGVDRRFDRPSVLRDASRHSSLRGQWARRADSESSGTWRALPVWFSPARILNWLYVAEGGKVFRRPVKVKGNSAASPMKPPKPPL